MKHYHLKRISIFILVLGFLHVTTGCSDNPETDPAGDISLSDIMLPSEYALPPGGELLFWGNGFKSSDKIRLTSSGAEYTVSIGVQSGVITFDLPDNFAPGHYKFTLLRTPYYKAFGFSHISMASNIDVPDVEGANIKGIVMTEDGTGIPDVCVSDGIEVVKTDADGYYHIVSEKKTGFVFVSVPGGYEVATEMCLPQLYQRLASRNTGVVDRVDFVLYPAENTDFTLIAGTDFHLANRNDDISQFTKGFMADASGIVVNRINSGKKVYCVTMGDLTWDIYWYSNSYALPNYKQQLNALGCPVFNVMGNHDNDYLGRSLTAADIDFNSTYDYMNTSDWVSSRAWRENIGPTYYSFNLGGVHFLSLDDMICTNDGTSGGRNYETTISDDQMTWIQNDLQFVDPSTPIFILMHVPFKNEPSILNVSSNRLSNAAAFRALFDSYETVHILTGHTHYGYNVVEKTGSGGLWYEHNTPAVCGTWWWTGRSGYTPNNLAPDGAPGGFCLYEIEGKDITWKFKGSGKDIDYQFRTYDLNKTVLLAADYLPNASEALKTSWKSNSYAGNYQTAKTNKVLINIWNWDPEWTVTVTEGTGGSAKALTATRVQRTDPLQLISYPAIRMNGGNAPTFTSRNSTHFFEVQATTATDPIYIEVKDRFGNIFTETMTRPKEVSRTME